MFSPKCDMPIFSYDYLKENGTTFFTALEYQIPVLFNKFSIT
jgi:hypothetical protein